MAAPMSWLGLILCLGLWALLRKRRAVISWYALMMTCGVFTLWGFQNDVRTELQTAQALEKQYLPTLTLLKDTQDLLTNVQGLINQVEQQNAARWTDTMNTLTRLESLLCRSNSKLCEAWYTTHPLP